MNEQKYVYLVEKYTQPIERISERKAFFNLENAKKYFEEIINNIKYINREDRQFSKNIDGTNLIEYQSTLTRNDCYTFIVSIYVISIGG